MTKDEELEDSNIRADIATSLVRRCNNCYSQLPGYQVKGKGWNWITPNFGPFCDECFNEVKFLLKESKDESKT